MIPWRYSFLELLHSLPPSGCPKLVIACMILSLEVQHGLPHPLCLNLVLSMPMVSVTQCVRQITTHRQPTPFANAAAELVVIVISQGLPVLQRGKATSMAPAQPQIQP